MTTWQVMPESNDDRGPIFSPTSVDSPIQLVSFALMASEGADYHASGSAVLVAPHLALTARHVLDDYWHRFEDKPMSEGKASRFSLVALNLQKAGTSLAVFAVTRTWSLQTTDLALLRLTPFSPEAADYRWRLPILDIIPPAVGDEISAFGYHSTHAASEPNGITLRASPASAGGVVRAVHLERRDRVRLPFPCFQTSARFDGGMSGGGVFNAAGRLCGIICQSLPPGADDPSAEHASYVSLLWPAFNIPIDDLYTDAPWSAPYTLFDLAKRGVCNMHGASHLTVVQAPTERVISLNYSTKAE